MIFISQEVSKRGEMPSPPFSCFTIHGCPTRWRSEGRVEGLRLPQVWFKPLPPTLVTKNLPPLIVPLSLLLDENLATLLVPSSRSDE